MITKCYFEQRKSAARGTDSLVADTMRHLHTRQHLGKTVVVCEHPGDVVGAARKQWLKLSRTLQKQRASTLNAEKILKYTHTIARMQRMHFSTRDPMEQPAADIYFLEPTRLDVMPVHCWTVYVLSPIGFKATRAMVDQLPSEALVVDYVRSEKWPDLGLQPKKILEARVTYEWRQVQQFLRGYRIDPTSLIVNEIHNVEAMDDALDTLLGGVSHRFLQMANEFQHALELARPLRLTKDIREAYDSFVLMAHRVQALTPGAFSQHFLETYNEDDTFFLYDAKKTRRSLLIGAETLADTFARHTNAGRPHLARSLRLVAQSIPG